MVSSRIVQLAQQIISNTHELDSYLQSENLPSPSFEEDGPVDFGIRSDSIKKAQDVVIDSTLELHNLLIGPALCLRPVLNGVSLQAIYKYNIASHVPMRGQISFEDLASKCGLDPINLRRILRFAMAHHYVFQEPRSGYVAHSAASRKLSEDSNAQATLGYMFDEVWQAFAHTLQAKEKFKSDEPNESGWSLSQHTDRPVWEHYASHPEMAKRFARTMSALAEGGNSPLFLVEGFSWPSVGDGSGIVVDVGGSKGDVSIAIAQSTSNLQFVVQDLPSMIKDAKTHVPNEVTNRIHFMAHDFFKDQTVQADVYLFRRIFHNWSDSHVVRILRATVPALKPGSRLVINDYLIPNAGEMSPSKERDIRSMDMIMLSLFNSRERDANDWRMIILDADVRFQDIKIWTPDGASLAIIEATWKN